MNNIQFRNTLIARNNDFKKFLDKHIAHCSRNGWDSEVVPSDWAIVAQIEQL